MYRRAWVSDILVVGLLLGSLHCSGASKRAEPELKVAPSGQGDLAGTSWRLVKFQGGDETILKPAEGSEYTIAFEPGGRLTATIDCNRGRGTWKSAAPPQLEFGPLALTRAMCPPGSLHDHIVKQWPYVRSYVMRDGHLFLSLMADGGIYEFEPLGAEGSVGKGEGAVRGTATYRERMALPPGAVLEATLEDVSRADAKAEEIGRTQVEHPGNPPIRFEIPYDRSRIDPKRTYAVRARIMVAGRPFFISDQHNPVLTGGMGNEVALMLRLVPDSGMATEPLENTYWKLMTLGDAPVTVVAQQPEPHLILNALTGRANGSGGCNRMSGSYQLSGDRLTLGPMAGTMMACAEGMETEKAFMAALGRVSGWRIAGQQLELLDADGNVIGKFEARHME